MFSIGKYLPKWMQAPLFGKREWSKRPVPPNDPDMLAWQKAIPAFYVDTQRKGLGGVVNNAGYSILQCPEVTRGKYFELGPGSLPHLPFWRERPESLDIADIRTAFLEKSSAVLSEAGIASESFLINGASFPVPDNSYDGVVSFYSLEHLNPLSEYLREIARILKPGGLLVGGIPTEGSLAWGLGRFLTSRRYVQKNFDFDFDKVIAIEHCNTAQEILDNLNAAFRPVRVRWWPLRLPLLDCNLIVSFIYEKK